MLSSHEQPLDLADLIFELDSIHTLKLTIAQNGGKVKKPVKTENSVH